MFSNLKFSVKLSALVLLLLGVLLGVSAFGLYALRNADARGAANLQLSQAALRGVDLARAAQVSFKNQVRDWSNILVRGHDQKEYDTYLAAFNQRTVVFRKELAEVKAIMTRLGIPVTGVSEAERMHADLLEQYKEALNSFSVARLESSQPVDYLVKDRDRALDAKIESIVRAMQKHAEMTALSQSEEASEKAARATQLFALLIVLGVVIGTAGAAAIARGIINSLDHAIAAANHIAGGDLTMKVKSEGQDETGQLLLALQRMQRQLGTTVQLIHSATGSVTQSAQEIAAGNAELSSRTEEQASALEETAASMEQMTATVSQNAENAKQANALASEASGIAVQGGAAVRDVVETMAGIAQASKKIADITGVIDGIAFQTNILALNAAVEAARAGEQGRGFAVVASEVRSLAQRSAAAAKEIKVLITDSTAKIEAGSRQVDAAGKTMDDVVGSVKRVSSLIAEIAAASQEQSQGIAQVSETVTQLERVTQQNAAMVEQASAAAASLEDQAGQLAKVVGAFKVEQHAGYAPVQRASAPRTATPLATARSGNPHEAPRTAAALPPQRPVAESPALLQGRPRARTASAKAEGWEEF